MRLNVPISVGGWGRFFTRWDVLAVLLVLGLLVFLAEASRHLLQPLTELQLQPVSLDPANLPEYAARTTLAHAHRHGAVAAVHLHLCDARRQEQTGRTAARSAARHPAVGADPRLHLHHRRVLHGARAGPRARRRIRRDFRDFHQPSLEHGVQLLSIAAHGADRTGRSVAQLPAEPVDELLAARRAVRDAAADLEHDDVDVGKLVLRGRRPKRSASAIRRSRCPASAPISRSPSNSGIWRRSAMRSSPCSSSS